jgi:hypothetical protein
LRQQSTEVAVLEVATNVTSQEQQQQRTEVNTFWVSAYASHM